MKKVNIKTCTCYYFDDIIRFEDFNFSNVSEDKKSRKIFFFYDILYKTLIGTKLLHIMFYKVNGFIRVYDV